MSNTEKTGRPCEEGPGSAQASYLDDIQQVLTDAPRKFYRRINNANALNKVLKRAAGNGKKNKVDFLLRCSLAHVDGYPRQTSPLFRAAMGGHVETVKLLLARGADPKRRSRGVKRRGPFTCRQYSWDGTLSTALHAAAGLTGSVGIQGFDGGEAPEEESIARARECCKLLINAGCDVNDAGWNGYTPLHMSVASNRASVAELLLQNGANPHISTGGGRTTAGLIDGSAASAPTIEILVKYGHLVDLSVECDGVIPILHIVFGSEGAFVYDPMALAPFVSDWNVAGKEGNTPLHIEAMLCFRAERIPSLVELGADVRRKNAQGKEPLHLVQLHRCESITLLLDAGADLEAKDDEGCTLLLAAMPDYSLTEDGFDYLQKLILEFHPDLGAMDNDGNGVFHKVCDWPVVTRLQRLQELGANPSLANNAGETALHTILKGRAVRQGNAVLEEVRWFMDAGLTSMHRDHMGNTPLHALCATRPDFPCEEWDQWPGRETADYLLSIDEGKACHVKNKEGYQPIHLAAANSKVLAWKLITMGVSTTARTNDGKGLLHIAAAAGQDTTVGLFLDHYRASGELEYQLGQTDNTGSTPLQLASRIDCSASVELLTKAGAGLDARDDAGLTPMEVSSE